MITKSFYKQPFLARKDGQKRCYENEYLVIIQVVCFIAIQRKSQSLTPNPYSYKEPFLTEKDC